MSEIYSIESTNFTIEDLGVCEEWVYDIEVEETHRFFANDILVHNSSYICLDSVVAKMCKGKADPEIVNFLEVFVNKVIQPVVNNDLKSTMVKMGVDDCRLSFKLECIGPSIILLSKKRYAFDILYSEGVRYEEPKTKVMGMEIVRSSTPSVIKDKLKKSVKLCLSSDAKTVQKFISEVKSSFMEMDYFDIAFPRGCNGLAVYSDPTNIYKKGDGIATPKHVRAALLYNHHLKRLGLDSKYPLIGEGDKIKFIALKKPNPFHEDVIGFPGKLPEEFGLHKYIDYETQYQKAFLKPIEATLAAVGWTAEEQVSLEDFF